MDFLKRLKEASLRRKIEYINAIPCDYEEYNSVIVGLIPYYAGETSSYFSKYTRGKDYHKLGRELLEDILNDLGISDFKIFVDVSPHNERNLALKAGLGVQGKNGLVINEKYGSYVFIMTAFFNTDEPLKEYKTASCINCKKCIDACPENALSDSGFDITKCISHITQKKQIEKWEENIIIKNKSAWGCDVCQDVCPLNKERMLTPFDALKENLLLEINDTDKLSNKKFKEKYGDYALSYKGKNIIKRNIELIKR